MGWLWSLGVTSYPEWTWSTNNSGFLERDVVLLQAKRLNQRGDKEGILIEVTAELVAVLMQIPEPRKRALGILMLDDALRAACVVSPGANFLRWNPSIYRGRDGHVWLLPADGFDD